MQWSVQFERRDHHTTAFVTSQPLATDARSSSDNTSPPSFSVTESDQDTLTDRIRSEIEQRDRPVLHGDPGVDED